MSAGAAVSEDFNKVAATPREYLAGLAQGHADRDGEVALLNATIRELRAAPHMLARAVLLFHGAVEWTAECRTEWEMLTGSSEATTRTLCDLARRTLTTSVTKG